MSQELVKVTAPKALSIPPDEAAAVQEAFAINIASGTVSEFDLPRIKVMSGAALWLIPSLETVFLAGDVWPMFLRDIGVMTLFGAVFLALAVRNTKKRVA